MIQSTVKWWNETKGIGFINGISGPDYFVHHTGIVGRGRKNLTPGQRVKFDTEKSDKGTKAVNVTAI